MLSIRTCSCWRSLQRRTRVEGRSRPLSPLNLASETSWRLRESCPLKSSPPTCSYLRSLGRRASLEDHLKAAFSAAESPVAAHGKTLSQHLKDTRLTPIDQRQTRCRKQPCSLGLPRSGEPTAYNLRDLRPSPRTMNPAASIETTKPERQRDEAFLYTYCRTDRTLEPDQFEPAMRLRGCLETRRALQTRTKNRHE